MLEEQPSEKLSEKNTTGSGQTLSDTSEYEAQLSIEGMTCASCSTTITKELESLDVVKSVNIILLSNSGTVRFQGPKENIDKIVNAIEDVGYEASVEQIRKTSVVPSAHKQDKKVLKAVLGIEGMTCASCIVTVSRGLEELPFVRSVNIDLIGHSGNVEYDEESNLKAILEKIDDLGYDATVISEGQVGKSTEQKSAERTVALTIEGMYCHHCPEKVGAALQPLLGDAKIQRPATLSEPVVTIAYTPSPPDHTIRNFVDAIEKADEAFHVRVYHPPSLEERSRQMQHREQWRILARLLFAFVVAIPTFIIAIVFMDLVPKTNSSRQWLEQPVWAGSVSRVNWALFIMTTPVMFFGADHFHVRALKEIRALWRKSSRVTLFRRFYRFGSMNLLISAGTAVAYFSSLAVLILDATTPVSSNQHGSDTYFDSVTFLTFFILIGKFLEAYSKAKTGDAVAMLSNLRPTEANLVTRTTEEGGDFEKSTGETRRVPVDMLEVGDTVVVPHGTSPPSDGVVVSSGDYLFDESSLTGESKPVKKVANDKVFVGAVNAGQPVQIQITDIGGTTMLEQIVSVVREGQTKRAPIERLADVLTGYFVPVITFVAILTWVIWLSLGESGALSTRYLNGTNGGWAFWSLEFAISVFVIACPCGIGLAAPTALFVGGGMAAKKGILVQGGGEAFQEASKIDAIVFDKTGTLTEGGSLKVTEHENLMDRRDDPEELQMALKMAMAMEEASNHPIAKAIVDFCKSQAYENSAVTVASTNIEEISGQGMRATFDVSSPTRGQSTYEAALGNQRLLTSLPSHSSSKSTYLDPLLSKYQSLGHSTCVLSLRQLSPDPTDFAPSILFAISDPIRPSALPVLNALRTQHNLSIHICTGDNHTTALAVATQLNIPASNVRANCLPGDKAEYIRSLQQPSPDASHPSRRRQIVAFIGDGTNDTPALSAADVSIALSSGSDVAVTTASFILLTPSSSTTPTPTRTPSSSSPSRPQQHQQIDLHLLLTLLTLSRRVFRRIKLNFLWAGIYNILLVPVAAGVFFKLGGGGGGWRLGPVWSAAAMAASSVSVVCSSLALRWEVRGLGLGLKGWRRGEKV